MKKINYYYCPICGELAVTENNGEVWCCGKKLERLNEQEPVGKHDVKIEEIEDEFYVTSEHSMTKEHFITAVFCIADDKVQMQRLYPKQNFAVRFKRAGKSKFAFVCNLHGLYVKKA